MPSLPPGPYRYMPYEHDQWGFVRDADGNIVANTSPPHVSQAFGETCAKKYGDWLFGAPDYHAGPPQALAVAELLIRAEREQDATPVLARIQPVAEEESELCTRRLFVRVAGVGLVGIEYQKMDADGSEDACLFVGPTVTRGQLRKIASALQIELKEPPT